MTILRWQGTNNIEQSLVDFIQAEITSSNIQVYNDEAVAKDVRVAMAFKPQEGIDLPVISVFSLSNDSSERVEFGSNKRLSFENIILDIFADNDQNRKILAFWLRTLINDGFTYYEYTPNDLDPSNPTKTLSGHVSLDFVSDVRVDLGENAHIFDKFRQRITINSWIKSIT